MGIRGWSLVAGLVVAACWSAPWGSSVWITAPFPVQEIMLESSRGDTVRVPPGQRIRWPVERGWGRGRIWLYGPADTLASPWFDAGFTVCWQWAPADWPRECGW